MLISLMQSADICRKSKHMPHGCHNKTAGMPQEMGCLNGTINNKLFGRVQHDISESKLVYLMS